MTSRGSKPDTAPNMMSVYVTPVGTDPDTVAYQYHRSSWGLYYGTAHYENAEVSRWIDEARAETDNAKRMALYARIQTQIVADQPEIFGMVANRIWARRDYVKRLRLLPGALHRRDRPLPAVDRGLTGAWRAMSFAASALRG